MDQTFGPNKYFLQITSYSQKSVYFFFGSLMQKRFSEYLVISGVHDMAKEKNRRPLREESCVKFISR